MEIPKNLTTNDLVAILFPTEEIRSVEEITRYVMYVRMSTESSERQAKSIPDQIAECKLLQQYKNLNVVEIIEEEKSAKEPDKREGFRRL